MLLPPDHLIVDVAAALDSVDAAAAAVDPAAVNSDRASASSLLSLSISAEAAAAAVEAAVDFEAPAHLQCTRSSTPNTQSRNAKA